MEKLKIQKKDKKDKYIYTYNRLLDHSFANWITNNYNTNYKESDIVLFEGGPDLNPKLYNHKQSRKTKFDNERDYMDLKVLDKAIQDEKCIIGICRGAQLICVAAGGKLIQNMEHKEVHDLNTFDGFTFKNVVSTHKQLQYPQASDLVEKEDYYILGSHEVYNAKGRYLNGKTIDREETTKDIEICYYPKIKALAIQTHPELMINISAINNYLNFLVEKLVNNTLLDYITSSSSKEKQKNNPFQDTEDKYLKKQEVSKEDKERVRFHLKADSALNQICSSNVLLSNIMNIIPTGDYTYIIKLKSNKNISVNTNYNIWSEIKFNKDEVVEEEREEEVIRRRVREVENIYRNLTTNPVHVPEEVSQQVSEEVPEENNVTLPDVEENPIRFNWNNVYIRPINEEEEEEAEANEHREIQF